MFFSTQPLRKVCIANRNIGQFCLKYIPFYFCLVISAVGISVPSIFCITKETPRRGGGVGWEDSRVQRSGRSSSRLRV